MKYKNFVTQLLFIYLDAKPVSLADQRIPIFSKKNGQAMAPTPALGVDVLEGNPESVTVFACGENLVSKISFLDIVQQCAFGTHAKGLPNRSQIYRFFTSIVFLGVVTIIKKTNSKRADIHKMLRHFTVIQPLHLT